MLSLTAQQDVSSCNQLRSRLDNWTASVRASAPTELVCSTASGFTRGKNRNLAAQACGNLEWIAFVDADDEMHPHRIERMLRLLHQYNASVGVHSFSSRNASAPPVEEAIDARMFGSCAGAGAGNAANATNLRTTPVVVTSPEDVWRLASMPPRAHSFNRTRRRASRTLIDDRTRMRMSKIGKTHHGHIVAHRSVMQAVGGYGETSARGEDVEFVHRLLFAGIRIVHTNEELTVYRIGATVWHPAREPDGRAGRRGRQRGHTRSSGVVPLVLMACLIAMSFVMSFVMRM